MAAGCTYLVLINALGIGIGWKRRSAAREGEAEWHGRPGHKFPRSTAAPALRRAGRVMDGMREVELL
jgi:hypothetical protein